MAQLENFRLKVFRKVAQHLSFRRAAEELFLTQPAITLQIKALEDDLSLRLFDRGAGRVALTPAGSILLRHAEAIAAIAREAEDDLAAAGETLSGTLDLGFSTTIAQYVLPHLIAAFSAGRHRVELSLRSGNTSEIVKLLLEGSISVGLIEGPARHRGVRTEAFMEDELVPIVPPAFEPDSLSLRDLVQWTLLLREQGSGTRRVVEEALQKAHLDFKAFRNTMELDSTEAIKSGVEAGLGLGFVSRWAIAKELKLGLLKSVPIPGVKMTRKFSLAFRTGPAPRGPSAAFCRFSKDWANLIPRDKFT